MRALNLQKDVKRAYARASPQARKLIARAGLDFLRGGPRSTELSSIVESVEGGPGGKKVRHTRVDPEKVRRLEELVSLGLAYVPSQADRDKLAYAMLTRLGEETAVLAAKSAYGPLAETDAKKFYVLDKASAALSEALYHIEDGTREDRFRRFSPEERENMEKLAGRISRLQAEVYAVRDGFRPERKGPPDARGPSEGPSRRRVTRPRRS